MRFFIQTSSWAIWAARIKRPVLPLVVLSIGLHYLGIISSPVFFTVIMLAITLSLVALLLGLVAYIRIWYNGDAGWRTASGAVLMGIPALVLLGVVMFYGAKFPQTMDVATDMSLPLWEDRVAPSSTPDSLDKGLFPNAATRQLQLPGEFADELIGQATRDFGWKEVASEQGAAGETYQFFEAKTLLGFVDDITLRVRRSDSAVVVDVRSASRFGQHDLGRNSTRIEEFLLRLDELTSSLVISETVQDSDS
ncbi:DUF1499 domain-containing protein [Maritalea sp.]|uniref:DUF1499 domain-containing protein n=1 Tax=Maritalea sp. TaxID=2003361 RepID=UPI003EF3BE4C